MHSPKINAWYVKISALISSLDISSKQSLIHHRPLLRGKKGDHDNEKTEIDDEMNEIGENVSP
ncbi:hypothetical protein DCAR_0519320 [Daucus carota subsp. sativus]|uniref:Uncharacterized protein n=1 Tax=Daucus carota subsp. sativus TaxID=79200 RepID=A0A161YJX4_DAUCS|nr:hypothetical protein DCAR_0519320 [Daucus carota subsp. sativus]